MELRLLKVTQQINSSEDYDQSRPHLIHYFYNAHVVSYVLQQKIEETWTDVLVVEEE